MKAYKAILGASVGLGVLSLLVGCDDGVMGPQAEAAELTVIVSPATAEIEVDQIVQFKATVAGETLTQVTWMTSDPEKARIVGDGQVLGVEPGAVAIIAEHAAGTGMAQVRVRYAPGSGGGDGDDGDDEVPDLEGGPRDRDGRGLERPEMN